MNNQRL